MVGCRLQVLNDKEAIMVDTTCPWVSKAGASPPCPPAVPTAFLPLRAPHMHPGTAGF